MGGIFWGKFSCEKIPDENDCANQEVSREIPLALCKSRYDLNNLVQDTAGNKGITHCTQTRFCPLTLTSLSSNDVALSALQLHCSNKGVAQDKFHHLVGTRARVASVHVCALNIDSDSSGKTPAEL